MRSSTSNSDERLPRGGWLLTWLATLALTGSFFGGYEVFWRSRGFLPSATDDVALWGYWRGQVRPNDPDQVVLLGASRIKLGVDVSTLSDALGKMPVIQLAVAGSDFRPILYDLSRDESFQGLAVCDLLPGMLLTGRCLLQSEQLQAQWLETYRQRLFSADFDQRLRLWIQERLTLLRSDLTLESVAIALVEKKRLPTPEKRVLRDRTGQLAGEVRGIRDVTPDWAKSLQGQTLPDVFEASLEDLRQAVQRIKARGGKVVFVRMPSTGENLRWENEFFPRDREWDRLAAAQFAPCIHFEDFPELASFVCPDGGHLDQRDALRFTSALAPILREQLNIRQATTGEAQSESRYQ